MTNPKTLRWEGARCVAGKDESGEVGWGGVGRGTVERTLSEGGGPAGERPELRATGDLGVTSIDRYGLGGQKRVKITGRCLEKTRGQD